jgi:hypothetical protein
MGCLHEMDYALDNTRDLQEKARLIAGALRSAGFDVSAKRRHLFHHGLHSQSDERA